MNTYEDRAELFSSLLIDRRIVFDVAAQDRVLRAKIEWLGGGVAARVPEMADAFLNSR